MTTPSSIKCWICDDDATTGEHKTKKSDLKSVFGSVTQDRPIFIHTAGRRNRKVPSLNAKVLKSSALLCPHCNNARTQPFDHAWQTLSTAIRARNPRITPGSAVRAQKVFPYDAARRMLDVHLFFVKLFGCHIAELGVPIDIADFAKAILNRQPHPKMYLKLCVGPASDPRTTGASDMWTAPERPDGRSPFATWFYEVDGLYVNVMYAESEERRQGLVGAWHPRLGTNRMTVAALY